MIGFRVSDEAAVQQQIVRLENLIRERLDAEAPELRDRLTREKIGEVEFLTMSLDGKLVPWDDVLADAELDAEEDVEKIKARLEATKFSISLGVWQSYLLLSLGEDNSVLAVWGRAICWLTGRNSHP